MVELDKNKIQIKYITGLNKTLPDYPTPLDVLYDSCIECFDDCLFSESKIENKYNIDKDKINYIINYLLDNGYIKKDKKNYKIINSIWH